MTRPALDAAFARQQSGSALKPAQMTCAGGVERLGPPSMLPSELASNDSTALYCGFVNRSTASRPAQMTCAGGIEWLEPPVGFIHLLAASEPAQITCAGGTEWLGPSLMLAWLIAGLDVGVVSGHIFHHIPERAQGRHN